MIRPTLASLPAMAVFTSGELTTALPIPWASWPVGAPCTCTRMTCCVPSPLRTTSWASSLQMRESASVKMASSSSAGSLAFFWLDSSMIESEVDWSLSTEMRLNEPSELTAFASVFFKSSGSASMSVIMYTSMVAMLGSIMPAPLAMPVKRPSSSPSLSRTTHERALAKVSVVMMPLAAGRTESDWSASTARGRASTMLSTGSCQPITPVDEGSTAAASPVTPSSSPTLFATVRASCTPEPLGCTFEILLFTTMAATGFLLATTSRPTLMGAPGKAFCVNMAA
mmetsp:Transcript_14019/g.44909  ORF Transcript_14019/g.44909 Transcript_14019/m.44909 type:complete len:283 (+) Transcript_14019:409-1257(+)